DVGSAVVRGWPARGSVPRRTQAVEIDDMQGGSGTPEAPVQVPDDIRAREAERRRAGDEYDLLDTFEWHEIVCDRGESAGPRFGLDPFQPFLVPSHARFRPRHG